MNVRAIGMSLVILGCAACPAVAEDKARLWIEAGPSFDQDRQRTNNPNGYALAGGVDLGRTFALTLGAGAEHYPLAGESRLVTSAGVGGPQTLRREGGGNKRVLCVMAGLRVAPRRERFEPFFEAGLGHASVAEDLPRYVDPATGAVVYPASRFDWSGFTGELGMGIRTRRQKSYDAMLGVRWRAYTQFFEGSSGASFQARAGVIYRIPDRDRRR